MASKPASILMFGATGNIGTPIINALARALGTNTFSRVAIFTSQSTVDNKSSVIKDLQARNVEIFAGDIANKSTLRGVISGSAKPLNPGKADLPFDTIISAAGRAAILSQLPILETAEQIETVKRFYPSEYGTDIKHPVTNDKEPPHQLKLKVRAYIAEHIKRLDVTYLVTGPYPEFWVRQTPSSPWTGGFDVKNKKAVLLYDGKGEISFTSMPDVATLLLSSLLHPSPSPSPRALKVRSFTTTPLAVLAEFEKQTGGEKWEVEYTSREKLVEKEKQAYENEGVPAGTGHTLRKIWADGGTLYKEGYANESIGVKEGDLESMESLVGRAIAEQMGGGKL